MLNRALSGHEQSRVWAYLDHRYGFESVAAPTADPELLALASLCHVLLNANEFIYVD